MNASLKRVFLMFLCIMAVSAWCRGQELRSSQNPAYPVHWGVGSGLHSSTEPTTWIGGQSMTQQHDQHSEGQALKEPVIPYENLEAKKKAESAAEARGVSESLPMGTFYEAGIASYYSARTHGRMMASGERYDREGLFCAHKTLPFGTKIRVVNKKNGKDVVVVVKDRGPFGKGRVVDLSNKAAAEIGMLSAGIVPCELWIVE